MQINEVTVSISQVGRVSRSYKKTYFVSMKGAVESGDESLTVASTLLSRCQCAIMNRAVEDGVELE